MKKLLTSLVLGLALSATGCGVFHARAPVQGEVNSFDGDTYLALNVAKGAIDKAKDELATGAFTSATVAANVKIAVNKAVQVYNVADVTYQAYHQAALAGNATPAQQAAVQSAVDNLNSTVVQITSAKAGN